MPVRVILAVMLAGTSVSWGQEPSRGRWVDREQARLIRELVRIVENQHAIGTDLRWCLEHRGCGGRNSPNYPRLLPPTATTIPAGEKSAVAVGIDWRLFKETELLVKLATSPADAEVELPAELIVVEEKSPERFEIPVKAGKTPGTFKLVVVPAYGEPIEFKVTVK